MLYNAPLFYPSAKDWMWDYCIYLGPFTDSRGDNFDLGIWMGDGNDYSAAIVYGDTPGDYYSGELNKFGLNDTIHSEIYKETRKRAKALNLIPQNYID